VKSRPLPLLGKPLLLVAPEWASPKVSLIEQPVPTPLTQLVNSVADPKMFPVTDMDIGMITLALVLTVISQVSNGSIELTFTCTSKVDPIGSEGWLAGEMKSCPEA